MIPYVVIIGLGRSGQAILAYCHRHSIPSLTFDDDVSKSGPHGFAALDSLPGGSVCVVSPGVPLEHAVSKRCHDLHMEVISEVEFALRALPTPSAPLIGVTGTNGKTTVVSLTEHLFSFAGARCKGVGNIGTPLIEVVDEPFGGQYVVELSSFQLERTSSPRFSLGCWTSFAPNHLDRHPSLEAYLQAKQRLLHCLVPDAECLVHTSVPELAPTPQLVRYGACAGDLTLQETTIVLRGSPIGRLPQSLKGAPRHDVENFLAAFWLGFRSGIDTEAMTESYTSFVKPKHRVELIARIGGVAYWDDSKGTNIAATSAAVASVPGPVVLIAGGVHKGFSYAPWREAFGGKVSAVVAMGQARHLIAEELGASIPVVMVETLPEAVEKAAALSVAGGSVLLSPGCSSYDMFKDYKERGDKFRALVLGRQA